jgi:hypothetical protein
MEFAGTGKKPYKGRNLAQSDNFIDQLSRKVGVANDRSKFIWRAADDDASIQRGLESSMTAVVNNAIEIINRELGKNIGKAP